MMSAISKPPNLSPELLEQLTAQSKYKARSHETLHETHFPQLSATKPLDVVLIGDSMIERFKTSGSATQTAQLPNCLNAGVGGDRIENVIYRLLLMLPLLAADVKLWVVMAGTNNLRRNAPLRSKEVEAYKLLVHTLCEVTPGSRVLVCGLFGRRDVSARVVEESSALLKGVVGELGERGAWLDAPTVDAEVHFEDHVHLNEVGYGVWDGVLFEGIKELLG